VSERLVIVGNGMAGTRVLEEMLARAPGRFDITVFGAEPHPAYNRIMLSPVLAGERQFADIVIHPPEWYAAHGVDLRLGAAAIAIEPSPRRIVTAGGDEISYDKLILATGSHPIMPPLPGVHLPGVVSFRDAFDVERMVEAAGSGRRAVVIGGGLLGLEAANGLRARGMQVTVVHLMAHLMERQLDAEAANMLRRELERRGIDIVTGAETQAILGTDRATGVRLKSGLEIPADLMVMAIGVRPNADVARAAGLVVERGIVVDDRMRTSDPDIFAVGECVQHRGACYGLVAPLYDMAAALAATLAGGEGSYSPTATATRLKVTGIDLFSAGDFASADDREDIVLRDPGRGVYRRLVLQDDRLIGAVLYGDTADGAFFFELIQSGSDTAPFRDTLIFGPALRAAA
jgi:nitrite reductase (NADH) large subunit